MVIEWGVEIDADVKEHLRSIGAMDGISGQEFLRRSVEREMIEVGEGRALAVVVGTDDRDDEDESIVAGDCVDCGAAHLDVFYSSQELGYSLSRSCFEARQVKERRQLIETAP